MEKQQALDQLKEEIINFKGYSDKLKKSMQEVMGDNYHPLPFTGSIEAEYMFIGIAPGRLNKKYKDENEEDSAFKYGSGSILRKVLDDHKIELNRVFFTNIVKSNTPADGVFLEEDIIAFSQLLLKEIKIINPLRIYILGSDAKHYFLNFIGKYVDAETLRRTRYVKHPAIVSRGFMKFEEYNEQFGELPGLLL